MLKRNLAVIAAMAIIFAMAGCSETNSSQSEQTTQQATTSTSSSQESSTKKTNSESSSSTEEQGSVQGLSTASADELFTERDLLQTADTSQAKTIEVKDSSTIDITEAGVYVIKGTAKDCTIKVNADSEAKVQLVLEGVSVTNSDFPAVYVLSADKVFVTTAQGSENTLSVTGEFKSDGDTNTDAVIFSKDDLVFNGQGTLKIESANANGISGKDDIKVTGGTYEITSALDSIESNDNILICDGSFTITSQKDALHCENDEDNTLGNIIISGGSFNITAESDAIQGNTSVIINGGTFNLSAAEGIESTSVVINDGDITIKASDDGINAGNKNKSNTTPSIEINGGKLTISMGQGDTDAIDANGNITVNGGTVNITSSGSSFDYDGKAAYNGGTIIINGSEVNEIPQSMMGGGGMRGGMKGGMNGETGRGMRGGF